MADNKQGTPPVQPTRTGFLAQGITPPTQGATGQEGKTEVKQPAGPDITDLFAGEPGFGKNPWKPLFVGQPEAGVDMTVRALEVQGLGVLIQTEVETQNGYSATQTWLPSASIKEFRDKDGKVERRELGAVGGPTDAGATVGPFLRRMKDILDGRVPPFESATPAKTVSQMVEEFLSI